MNRDYPTRPIVGVGVVVKNDTVLLIKRSKPPKSDEWSIPGGMQEVGETTKDAAIREVREETAVTIKDLYLLDVIDYIDPDEKGMIKHHYTLIDYAARYHSGILTAHDDAHDARWVPIDQIPEYNLWPKTEKIIYNALATLNKQTSHDR